MIPISDYYAQQLGRPLVNTMLTEPLCVLLSSFVTHTDEAYLIEPKVLALIQTNIHLPEAYPLREKLARLNVLEKKCFASKI